MLAGCGLACLCLEAGAAAFALDVARIEHPGFTIEGLHVALAREGGPAELAIDRFTVGDRSWRRLRLACPTFELAGGQLRCPHGSVSVPGMVERARIELRLAPARRMADVRVEVGRGEFIEARAEADGRVRIEARSVDLARAAALVPTVAAYAPRGRLSGRAEWRPGRDAGRFEASGELVDAAFASADGLRAGERLRLAFDLHAKARGGRWAWRGDLSWREGEAYLHPLYFTAGPLLRATGTLGKGRLEVTEATLAVDGVRSIVANGVVDLADARVERAAAAIADADLAVVGPRYIAPWLAPAQVDALRFGGRLSAGVTLAADGPTAVDVGFDEAAIALADKALAFGPVSGHLPWRRDRAAVASLRIGGGRWDRLELGPFDVDARLEGDAVEVDRVAIPVLDGRLVLQDLALQRRPEGWVGHGGAVVEPLSMSRLTAAVGLPVMSGTLAASLPRLTVAPGEISLEGALVISVFDGYVQLTGLHVLEPFGLASHAYADVEARHLDLAQMTRTFDFGSITGYVDADVRGLELARWRPVRFDARVASSPGRYPKRISQRAVENISALGGEGAAVAIQRSFLRFFQTFGYSEIGLSCALADGVCRMGGIEGDRAGAGGSFQLVRGGGVPALNVIGYNRRVDWNELIDRLRQAIASNAAPVVR